MSYRILLIVLVLFGSSAAFADAAIPSQDEPGSKDLPFLKRYEGSYIVNYEHKNFDEASFPLSPIKMVADKEKRDSRNNHIFEPEKKADVEGAYTRLLYVLPAERSPLEVMRNYLDEIAAASGKVLFSCKNTDCGGDMQGNDTGGGYQGIFEKLYPHERIKAANFSNGNCGSTMDFKEQRYAVATLPSGGGDTTLAVMTYSVNSTRYCKALNGRTIAMVVAIEPKAREKRMVTVSAGDMAKSIEAIGKVTLYGIYFDTNKSVVKPESKPTLDQIAQMLNLKPTLKLGVVGHTDNVGGADANLALSKRRSEAVVRALVEDYGVAESRLTPTGAGMGSPVASNDAEDGRAKNRRVELVKK